MPSRRWGIALLLGFGVLVNYFDRVNLSVSQKALTDTFGISAVTFGYLSSFYNWPYAALQLPAGIALWLRFSVPPTWSRIRFNPIWSIVVLFRRHPVATRLKRAVRRAIPIGHQRGSHIPRERKGGLPMVPATRTRSLATAMFDSAAKFAPGVVPIIGIFLLHWLALELRSHRYRQRPLFRLVLCVLSEP